MLGLFGKRRAQAFDGMLRRQHPESHPRREHRIDEAGRIAEARDPWTIGSTIDVAEIADELWLGGVCSSS